MIILIGLIWVLSAIGFSGYMMFYCKKGEEHERVGASILGGFLACFIGPFIFFILLLDD